MKSVLDQTKKVYFIGIGGIGISAIARMLLAEGKEVSGSDLAESEITHGLQKLGAKIFIGQKKENIPAGIDLFIYTVAVKENNTEFMEAKNRGVKMLTYAQTLNEISKAKYTIAVSGTHGKTTTTAMIAKILIDAGLDPTVIVGSLIKDKKGESTNFIAGRSKYFVVEACEYDRSFLNIEPKVAIINNIDNDHLDYYGSIEGVIAGFREFAEKVPMDGFIVCDPKDEKVAKAIKGLKCHIVDRNEFYDPKIKLKVFGEHNRRNAATALITAKILGVETEVAKKALSTFVGTWRRFEFKGETKKGTLVYEDYGHHPTEIKATLAGAKELYPNKKIVVVFQPHLYSRTKILLADFAKSFTLVDQVFVLPIYAAREQNDPEISSEILVEEIKKNKVRAQAIDFKGVEKELIKLMDNQTLILTLGAGDAYKVGEKLL